MRKDLLIAESELNRGQLMEEWDAATEWHRTLSAGARTVGLVASAVAMVVSGLRAFRRKRGAPDGAKSSWSQPINKVVGTISSLWEGLRSRGCDQNE